MASSVGLSSTYDATRSSYADWRNKVLTFAQLLKEKDMEDDNLKDFYAGLAMLGLLSAGRPPSYAAETSDLAWDMAETMMAERNQRKERNVNDRAK